MGRSRTSDISVARVELIRKGLVYPPERGQLAFTVPGMHDFVTRQDWGRDGEQRGPAR